MFMHKVGKSGRRKRGGWPLPSAQAVLKRTRRGLGGNIASTIRVIGGIICVLMLI